MLALSSPSVNTTSAFFPCRPSRSRDTCASASNRRVCPPTLVRITACLTSFLSVLNFCNNWIAVENVYSATDSSGLRSSMKCITAIFKVGI